MDDWEPIKSAVAIFQTYDTSGPSALYRSALVLRQEPERPFSVDGKQPPFGLFLVEGGRDDAKQPNSLVLRGYDDLDDATAEAIRWLGTDRPVEPEAVPLTVLVGIANVMRDPDVVSRYAP